MPDPFLSYRAMATDRLPLVPLGGIAGDAAMQQSPWRKRAHLSSALDRAEAFLEQSGQDRGPWLTAGLAGGIGLWFGLDRPGEWILVLVACALVALVAPAVWRRKGNRSNLVRAAVAMALAVACGLCLIWARSAIVGTPAIERPMVASLDARVLERIEQPADERIRLVLAARHPGSGEAMRVRVNLPLSGDRPGLVEGALIRLRVRLLPPASPMLPGAYDFARTAWFQGLAATGSVLGDIEIREAGSAGGGGLARLQRRLSAHVRTSLEGSPAAIAAALASGDRGAIGEDDEVAMRDAGLTHLLSISGLHVSAVIAAAYLLAIRLLALWPWLALRVRLPLLAAAVAALAGIGYTLLTGAEVPTVRSCVGALLVLGALALGREPLSLRMVAVAAAAVLLLWPESLVHPGFQMSFAAVIAIVALHGSAPVRRFLAPREEGWMVRNIRRAAMLLVTGLVIEIALMPIVLFHFHRAGVYGAFANVVAIPLTTFVSMPLIALALLLDLAGLGQPAWWLAGKSLELLLAIAHGTAGQPGAVKQVPTMGAPVLLMFVLGGLWLALWQDRVRLWGLVPGALAALWLVAIPKPDLLVSGDGRHVGIVGAGERLVVLREGRSDYARDNLLELAGMGGEPLAIDRWEGALCSRDFCSVELERGGRVWHILLARSRTRVPERELAAACDRADIVIADRWLPGSCRPRWFKADRKMLQETGGLAVTLSSQSLRTVADSQGEHGWWRGKSRR